MHAHQPRQPDTIIPAYPGFTYLVYRRTAVSDGGIGWELLRYPVVAWRQADESYLVPVMSQATPGGWYEEEEQGVACLGRQRPDGSVQDEEDPEIIFDDVNAWIEDAKNELEARKPPVVTAKKSNKPKKPKPKPTPELAVVTNGQGGAR